MPKKSVEIPQSEPTPQEIAELLADTLLREDTITAIAECGTAEEALGLAFAALENLGVKNPTALLVQKGILEKDVAELSQETIAIIEKIKGISREIAKRIGNETLDLFILKFHKELAGKANNCPDEQNRPFGGLHAKMVLNNSIIAYTFDSDQETTEDRDVLAIFEFRKQFLARINKILN